MYEQPAADRSRGPLMVALAVLFLAIIGGAVGLIAAHNTVDKAIGTRPDGTPTSGPGAATTSPGTPPATTTPPPPPPAWADCPKQADDRAGKPLSMALFVRTTVAEGNLPSVIWICADAEGKLYYLGHRGAAEDPPTKGNWLFLTGVEVFEETGYVASNRSDGETTSYTITREKLTIVSTKEGVEPITETVAEVHDKDG